MPILQPSPRARSSPRMRRDAPGVDLINSLIRSHEPKTLAWPKCGESLSPGRSRTAAGVDVIAKPATTEGLSPCLGCMLQVHRLPELSSTFQVCDQYQVNQKDKPRAVSSNFHCLTLRIVTSPWSTSPSSMTSSQQTTSSTTIL